MVEDAEGVRQLVHLGDAGQGINRQLVHLGNAGRGINRQRVHLGDAGRGINRQRVHLGDAGRGDDEATPVRASTASESTSATRNEGVYQWMQELSNRLKRVRVCSGDWSRVCGNTVTVKQGLTAVFLDPPYADTADRTSDLYREDSESVAHTVREWAIANGDNPKMRIALCGYEGEHELPNEWECLHWKTSGGYGSQGSQGSLNAKRERIWFSPHCVRVETKSTQRELITE